MKAFLMYRDRDFDLKQAVPAQEPALTQDLELNTLFNAMAGGDQFLLDVARAAVLSSLNDPAGIQYRQAILADCLKNPALVRRIYDLAVETIVREKKDFWGLLREYPSTVLSRSRDVLQLFVIMLKKLRQIADEHAAEFDSAGFITLFAMLRRELDDAYFARVETHLKEVQFRDGVLISAELGEGNKGANYVLRQLPPRSGWFEQIFGPRPSGYVFCIADRDESGFRALGELRDRGINLVANALAQSVDHILSFFSMLRTELAFYVGCLNLAEHLTRRGEPICFPLPVARDERRYAFTGLYDVALALSVEHRVVGNDLQVDGKDLVLITGANQGGKSTFLRSVGLAQLMMQCGLFVAAESFSATVCDGLFTHYKREEDATMESGKLDEELRRMSGIADGLTANSLVLFNESFAATNEREGSEIARQIVRALLERGVRVFFVTHLYEFAHGLYTRNRETGVFLRAPRESDGRRTFKLSPGEPLPTSFGPDLYYTVFGASSSQGRDGRAE